jgi:hypothetical protein
MPNDQSYNDEDESKLLKVFNFDGSHQTKFREWKIKTSAYARRKKFMKGFEKTIHNEDGIDADGSTFTKSSAEDIKIKHLAMDYLICSLKLKTTKAVSTRSGTGYPLHR